ncbi:glycosyl hydrolase family 5 [Chloroflexia bacterium SDU3-3]|nr:glycosyl hydrolase family 5 [Chloroflexia bacterium SDU3-3]
MRRHTTSAIRLGATLLATSLLAGALPGHMALAAPAADPAANERVTNGTFDTDAYGPWWGSANTALDVVDGKLCVDVAGGTANPWDAMIGQSNVLLENGESYLFSFEASASAPTSVQTTVQIGESPYTAALAQRVDVGTAPQSFSFPFTSNIGTSTGQVTFQMGGGAAVTVCLDNISLLGGQGTPPTYEPDTGPRVRVNQLGYAPGLPKRATVVTDSATPVAWELRNSAGATVMSGSAAEYGYDAASGDTVQRIDFSSYAGTGSGFTLVADGETSYPFTIASTLYDTLRYDALAYFYHNRSGIPIEAQYVGEQYARPAGHVGIAPNQGDTSVPCAADVPCDYRLDVSGGWYDAGDQGKYVVNGGISVWMLQNQYERLSKVDRAALADFGDGALQIPERQNGAPDLLDEARWEMEFLLKMQVPAGQPLAGMAHHKMHDANWTGFPMRPDLDSQPRVLRPPSTAATLNLAAAAAQCARVWQPYDAAFADRCLAAAQTAWQAALAHPSVLAPASDGTGGGAYNDTDVSDEFYWAAAELFATTGEAQYHSFMAGSPHYALKTLPNGIYWGAVAPLGDLSLLLAEQRLTPAERQTALASLTSYADAQLATIGGQGYPAATSTFYWGSNSDILNRLLLVSAAYDYTGAQKYLDGVAEGFDYILGRNALNHSYVTGYGTVSSQNQHHRFWAHQTDAAYPNPAPGAISGGANSGLDDPYVQKLLTGCKPQKCFIDHIDSYSTNEVAINWNAPLAWVAGFLSSKAHTAPLATSLCASPVDLAASGSYDVAAGGTCFRYTNMSFGKGGLFNVRNLSLGATNTVLWQGVRDQNERNCSLQSAKLSGMGGQVNNIAVARSADGAMYLIVKGSIANRVQISVVDWRNGSGC